ASDAPLLVTIPVSPTSTRPPSATRSIYTLSLHDALPILRLRVVRDVVVDDVTDPRHVEATRGHVRRHEDVRAAVLERLDRPHGRSEEHTSELQSRFDLVCRLLLEKKNQESTTNAD